MKLLLPALCAALCAASLCDAAALDAARGVIDLHAHTTLSDGSDDPAELVRRAHAAGVTTLAITDHDRVQRLAGIEELALELGIDLVYGVEISCEFAFRAPGTSRSSSKAHLLGHHVDPTHAPLVAAMKGVQDARDQRNRAIVARMAEMGVQVSLEAWLAESPDPTVLGRPHLARLLVKMGVVPDIPAAFANYLSDEKLQLTEWGLPVEEAVALVHAAGGVATLAHAKTLKIPPAELAQELKWLQAEAGLDGLEVYSSKHDAETAAALLRIADELGLVPTGGSDYHGVNKQDVPLARFGGNDEAWAVQAPQTARRLRAAATAPAPASKQSSYTGADSFVSFLAIVATYGASMGAAILALRWMKGSGSAAAMRFAAAVLEGNPVALDAPKGQGQEDQSAAKGGALQLAFCFVGLQSSYVLWGVMQESLMTTEYENGQQFNVPQFLVFANRFGAAAVAAGLCTFFAQPVHRAPWYKYSFTSLSNIMSSWCQYEALRFLSFPTQVLSKSSKIIPVMIMGWFMHGKTYPAYEYVVAVFISVGVASFALAQHDGGAGDERESSFAGLVLICMYLTCDSFTSQWQGGLFKSYGMSSAQMMLGTNIFSSLFTFSQMLVSGGLWEALAFFGECPRALMHVIALATTSAVGQQFIFLTLKKFGPLVFTIIMTVRMMASMVVSWFFFGHDLPPASLAGATVVFCAVGYRIYRKSRG